MFLFYNINEYHPGLAHIFVGGNSLSDNLS